MKDLTQQQLETHRPQMTALEAINFTLEQLYDDNTVSTSDALAKNLTYEELIGALLLAKDALLEMEEE